METARVILERGGAVGIFPEGTRVRPGPLGEPRAAPAGWRSRPALPIIPVAITGTEDIRRGWRIRPRRVTVRCGQAHDLPAAARRHAQCGPGARGHAPGVVVRLLAVGVARRHAAAAPRRRGRRRQLGHRGRDAAGPGRRDGPARLPDCRAGDAELAASRTNVALPARLSSSRRRHPDDGRRGSTLPDAELVCLAVPAQALPAALGSIERPPARGPRRPGAQQGSGRTRRRRFRLELRPAHPGSRPVACLGGPVTLRKPSSRGAALVVGSQDRRFAALLAHALPARRRRRARPAPTWSGVELAGVAKNAAALAAAAALPAGANAAGAAAGRIYAECHALATARGAQARDLQRSGRYRRPGRHRAGRDAAATAAPARCWRVESARTRSRTGSARCPRRSGWCPRWHARCMRRTSRAPATAELAALVEGRVPAERWIERASRRARRSRAA